MAVPFQSEIDLKSTTSWYHAAICTELGKPLQIERKERPALKDNQIRLAVKRAAVNFSDVIFVEGRYPEASTVPFTPGLEIVGQVIETGSKVTRLKPGETVVGLKLDCGGFAEELVALETLFHPISSRLSPEEGVAAVVSYGTAEVALERVAQIKESDVVLVTAAAGALGLAAVDLAANVYKASVIGACGGPGKCQIASNCGAKFTIDYKTENLQDRVKEITKGRGVDIVFDSVGGEVLEQSIDCLAFEGKLLTIGYSSGQIPKIPANLLLVKNISVHGVYLGSYSHLNPEVYYKTVTSVLQLLEEGKIKPHIGRVFPLSQVNEALEYVASRQSTGKVIIDCTKV